MPFKIYDSYLELSTEYSIIIILSGFHLLKYCYCAAAAAKSKSWSCPTLCDPMVVATRLLCPQNSQSTGWVASFQHCYTAIPSPFHYLFYLLLFIFLFYFHVRITKIKLWLLRICPNDLLFSFPSLFLSSLFHKGRHSYWGFPGDSVTQRIHANAG